MDLVRLVLESILFASLVALLLWTNSSRSLLRSMREARTSLLALVVLLSPTLSVLV
jgi:hypothetical protein